MNNQDSSNLEGIVEELDAVNEKLDGVLDQLDELDADMQRKAAESKAKAGREPGEVHKSTVIVPNRSEEEPERKLPEHKFFDAEAGP